VFHVRADYEVQTFVFFKFRIDRFAAFRASASFILSAVGCEAATLTGTSLSPVDVSSATGLWDSLCSFSLLAERRDGAVSLGLRAEFRAVCSVDASASSFGSLRRVLLPLVRVMIMTVRFIRRPVVIVTSSSGVDYARWSS
jgi:hypothetical protein